MVNKQISSLFQAQQPAIASYNWTDIAAGAGFITFSLFSTTTESGGDDFHLSQGNPFSSNIYYSHSDTSSVTLNFDSSPLNNPFTLKGEAIFSGEIWVESDGTATTTGYVTASLVHYDGTTETTLDSGESEHRQNSNNSKVMKEFCLNLDTKDKHFEKGDIVRLKLVLPATPTGGQRRIAIGIDPAGRAEPYDVLNTTNTTLLLPLNIEA